MVVPLTLFTCWTPLTVLGLLMAGAFWLCRPLLWFRIGPGLSAKLGADAARALAFACGAATNPESVTAAVVRASSRTPTVMPANEFPAR
ncbi:hypothetical protein [Planotetraspora silvatica]|uniref:hypothetical protein n=1 Tax=Planotetraspora silvatica TaxID=234614 RepID=UPI00194FA674|nr:hypothetical protein [Planotetraspora silvatica]